MKRILVAYDGGDPARRALDTAIDLPSDLKPRSRSSASFPCIRVGMPMDPWDDREVHAQELREARQLLKEHGITAELLEPAGATAPTMERIAEEGGSDTVVVGSRGLGAVSRFLQGSVSEHVATHAAATVVVVR